jgi:hypothetical protein
VALSASVAKNFLRRRRYKIPRPELDVIVLLRPAPTNVGLLHTPRPAFGQNRRRLFPRPGPGKIFLLFSFPPPAPQWIRNWAAITRYNVIGAANFRVRISD